MGGCRGTRGVRRGPVGAAAEAAGSGGAGYILNAERLGLADGLVTGYEGRARRARQGGTRGSSMASGSSAWKERGTLSREGKDHEKSLFGGARGVGCSQRS